MAFLQNAFRSTMQIKYFEKLLSFILLVNLQFENKNFSLN